MKLALFSCVALAMAMPAAMAKTTIEYTDKTLALPIMASSRGASSVVPTKMGTAFFPEVLDILPHGFLPRSVEVPKPRGYQNKRQIKHQNEKRTLAAAASANNDSQLLARDDAAAAAAAMASPLATRAAPQLRFGYGGQKVRGVSLGGWLVVENFIAPSVYDQTGNPKIIDEWSFGSLQSRSRAASILQRHLDTFVTEDDFRQIAQLGLNHVRIPIGYWAFEVAQGEPFVKLNQWDKLKQAAAWASKYNLKVLVDLHAIPGSANGYDHGGRKGVNSFASKKSNLQRTLAILNTMSKEFSQPRYANSVAAIELVNEPILDDKTLLDLYYKGYDAVRNPNGVDAAQSPLLVVVGDGFKSPAYGSGFWNGKFPVPQYEGVALDSHIYTIFDDDSIRLKSADRIGFYCSLKSKWAAANNNLYSIVGEWTPAFTDCAVGLNGRGTGARYDGTFAGSRGRIRSCGPKSGSASGFSDGYKTLLGKMWEAQVDANEGGSGWIMWTWKTEPGKAEDWSYQKGVEYGWIPRDPTARPNGIRC
ncbi:uncharacterized protein PFL1_05654 [Pseudozyma flocculosa PF-1]|uniref:Related to EXG1 - exo-beta-1,3-glucanase n=2 Tax=Pseudozyma flocculosa TaxID=84751 RepID=A0A5C3FFN4_9BASI|nr:uncharacterized protein PFL1_05654 [Pseudozyma flocculosa PF-1]EPQ26674.1 hypothetical protein PFL1_05654 [Pseudozyma flocculosa PF-1]SPO42159.1 related to EXG1 - exo-beta-1,3-glucanase [Pseudozyma flocculosa]